MDRRALRAAGRLRDNGRNNRPVTTNVSGILRRFAANQLVIES